MRALAALSLLAALGAHSAWAAGSDADRLEAVLARPLFSAGRRPQVGEALAAAKRATPLPRLCGIIADSARRRALFAAGAQLVVTVEGDRIGPFTVLTIEPRQVTVAGPDGVSTLSTSFDRSRAATADTAPPASAPIRIAPLALAGPRAGHAP